MKSTAVVVGVAASLLLTACKEDGSLSSHAECVARKVDNGLSDDVARELCSAEHEKAAVYQNDSLKASLSRSDYEPTKYFLLNTGLGNSLKSTKSPIVITAVKINVTINNITSDIDVNDLWIEPGNFKEIRRVLEFSKFQLPSGTLPENGTWSWNLTEVRGLSID